ncbi:Aldehyde oxidase/xanthine dehydrogenase molybdopterin binding, partial [Trinorchestia longiramus]
FLLHHFLLHQFLLHHFLHHHLLLCHFILHPSLPLVFNPIIPHPQDNRWRKRGLSVTPLKYDFPFPPFLKYAAQVSIYEQDGSVAICHGGIEMGQGINTKAAQVAAATLGVAMDLIKVKPTSSFTVANSTVTGASYGSDMISHAVRKCCERLKQRLDDFQKTQKAQLEWPQLVKLALLMDVDLTERYWLTVHHSPGLTPQSCPSNTSSGGLPASRLRSTS